MGKNFNHITSEEREVIAIKSASGVKPKDIAKEIGKHVQLFIEN